MIGEALALACSIMGWGRCAYRRLNAKCALIVKSRDIIAQLSSASAVLQAGLDGASLSAVIFDLTSAIEASILGANIYDPLIAVAEFGGHKILNQRHASNETCTEQLAETAHRIRQEDSIEPVLDTTAIETMNVNLTLALTVRVLSHTGGLNED